MLDASLTFTHRGCRVQVFGAGQPQSRRALRECRRRLLPARASSCQARAVASASAVLYRIRLRLIGTWRSTELDRQLATGIRDDAGQRQLRHGSGHPLLCRRSSMSAHPRCAPCGPLAVNDRDPAFRQLRDHCRCLLPSQRRSQLCGSGEDESRRRGVRARQVAVSRRRDVRRVLAAGSRGPRGSLSFWVGRSNLGENRRDGCAGA